MCEATSVLPQPVLGTRHVTVHLGTMARAPGKREKDSAARQAVLPAPCGATARPLCRICRHLAEAAAKIAADASDVMKLEVRR